MNDNVQNKRQFKVHNPVCDPWVNRINISIQINFTYCQLVQQILIDSINNEMASFKAQYKQLCSCSLFWNKVSNKLRNYTLNGKRLLVIIQKQWNLTQQAAASAVSQRTALLTHSLNPLLQLGTLFQWVYKYASDIFSY